MAEDGELSDGELPSGDEQENQTNQEPKIRYALFSANQRAKDSSQQRHQVEQETIGDDDMAMDPYSNYQPQAPPLKNDSSDSSAPPPNTHLSDSSRGEKNSIEFTLQSLSQNQLPLIDTVEPEPKPKGKQNKNKQRRKRHASDEFLKELSNYEKIKDGPSTPVTKKKRNRGYAFDKNYHDFDNPPRKFGGRDGSDISDDEEAEGKNQMASFQYRLGDAGPSDDEMSDGGEPQPGQPVDPNTVFTDDRPKINDHRKRSPSRAKKNRNEEKERKFRQDHKPKIYERKDHRKEKKSPWPKTMGRDDMSGSYNRKQSTERERKELKEMNLRKHELCKYYIAGTCLKGERCHYMHKSYPCKYHHIAQSCCKKNCLFSHEELTPITSKIIEKIQLDYFQAEDSYELDFVKDHGVDPLPKPPPGVPLMPTPPPKLICDKFTGKVEPGPRPLVPLPGEKWPCVLTCEPYLTQEGHTRTENILRSVMGKAIGEDVDVVEETHPEMDGPQPDHLDADSIGWIMFEWHNRTMPVANTGRRVGSPDTGMLKPLSPRDSGWESHPPSRLSPDHSGNHLQAGSYRGQGSPRSHDAFEFDRYPPIRPPIGGSSNSERYGMDPRDRLSPPSFMRDQDDRSFNQIVKLQEDSEDLYRDRELSPEPYRFDDRGQTGSPEVWRPSGNNDKYGFNNRGPYMELQRSRTPSPRPYRPNDRDDWDRDDRPRDEPRWPDYDVMASRQATFSPMRHFEDNEEPPAFPAQFSPKKATGDDRLDNAKSDLHENYSEAYVPKNRNTHVRDTIQGTSRVRRPSAPLEPRTETCHIPTTVTFDIGDPREAIPCPRVTPTDLPIPDLIEVVDFRVTFTINGAPYQMPDIVQTLSDKPKLPNLPELLMPRVSDPRNNPIDPRRRSISSSLSPSAALDMSDHWGQGAGSTPSRKKISLSDYRRNRSDKPDQTAVPPALPIIYGNQN